MKIKKEPGTFLTCELCPESKFMSMGTLRKYQTRHIMEKTWICDECIPGEERRFYKTDELRKHAFLHEPTGFTIGHPSNVSHSDATKNFQKFVK
ncbi:unnamed protein product [Caenorhabditis nigoni]